MSQHLRGRVLLVAIIVGCEFSGNSCGLTGGGLSISSSTINLGTTVVCGNTPDQIDASFFDLGGNEVGTACPCPADLDDTGSIGFGDLVLLLSAWDSSGGPTDLDGGGTVGFGDLVLLLSQWGPCI